MSVEDAGSELAWNDTPLPIWNAVVRWLAIQCTHERLALGAILVIAAILRVVPTLGTFPLGDGGLYLKMIDAVEARGWIAETVSYGGQTVPFAYPPGAFALTAALHLSTGVPFLTLLALLPPAFGVATVVGVHRLAKELLWRPGDDGQFQRYAALIAALLFAITPSAYRVIFLGGGLTKAPALFLSLLALSRVAVMLRDRSRAEVPRVALLAGLAALFHPDGALLVAIGSGTILVMMYRNAPAAGLLLVAALAAAAVAGLWWIPVVILHGAGPILSAASVDHDLASLPTIVLVLPFAGVLPMIPALAWLGALGSWRSRLAVLPVLYVAIAALDPRNSQADGAVVESILGAVGAVCVAPVIATRLLGFARRAGLLRAVQTRVLLPSIGLLLVAIAVAGPLMMPIRFVGPRVPLSDGDRTAMAEIAETYPEDARFAVLTGVDWTWDDLSEWFPALAERQSVNTVQGYEWLGVDAWRRRNIISVTLQDCVRGPRPLECVERTLAGPDMRVDYLYVAGPLAETSRATGEDTAAELRAELLVSPRWVVAYSTSYASVFRRH